MNETKRPLAIITGASSGIGYELAILAGLNGYDLVVAADEPRIVEAAANMRKLGVDVEAIEADLSTLAGNEELLAATKNRQIDVLCANAGHGLGRSFLEQDFDAVRHVIDTNVTGTLYLIHEVGRAMREQGRGKILITGSIAGYIPGTYQAVYNGTKAMIDSFAMALRAELKGSGVTVTNLMPGLTETEFFRRADLLDTKAGSDEKQSPAEVARIGFEAMQRGEAQVVAGWKNKLQVMMAGFMPATVLAEQHRAQTAPGTARS